ncbi:MAG: aspartate--tRNA ligase [Gemmatimonadales bacterium]|nr:MAG: aspartate--tRNA ligase [Gemmatimonadales bacterium]
MGLNPWLTHPLRLLLTRRLGSRGERSRPLTANIWHNRASRIRCGAREQNRRILRIETTTWGATEYRDMGCGQVTREQADRTIRLAGWVHRRRDLGGVLFLHLRDRTGLIQLSFGPEWTGPAAAELAGSLSPEDVIQVTGRVVLRPESAVNPEMTTGSIEVLVSGVELLSSSDPLPILVAVPPEEELPSEELRLRHRVLDLRRPEMLSNFEIRHRTTRAARSALSDLGFLEVETPFLTRRTPEGARDYLVPSRLHHGEFYSLPQSPQLYKQLLMTAGFDRYFQIERCLRDEDLRADRQPEFTQIDVEMAFVGEEDIYAVCENMLRRVYQEALAQEVSTPFPRMGWAEAMESYGTDKPDLRISWRLADFTERLTGLGFGIFDSAADAGGRIRGFVIPGGASLSRARLDGLNELAQATGARGALWIKRNADGWSGPVAKVLNGPAGESLVEQSGLVDGDLVLLIAGIDRETSTLLDALRRAAAKEMDAVNDTLAWLWVTDFPLFESDLETGRPKPSHHPFTMPRDATPERIREEPLTVQSRAYDLVLNGTELASGSIRCHDSELQRAILETLGMSAEEIEARFGFLLEAFRYGVPPHGGFALGLDRLVAMMVGAESIREVIAFPKTTAARGLMEGAPSAVDATELAELGLKCV